MAFKIKDLMISDISAGTKRICGVHEFSCQLGSKIVNYGCNNGCTNLGTPLGYRAEYIIGGGFPIACDVGTYIYQTLTITPLTPVISPVRATSVADLAVLKEQLKQQLAEVEKQETAAEASLQPQTVEEVDALAEKLREALEELKARRAELSK